MLFERLRGLALIAFRGLNGIRVSFPRSVADLAPRDVTLAGNAYFGVSSFFVLSELRLMARPALVNASVIGGFAFEEPRGYRCALCRFGHLLRQC